MRTAVYVSLVSVVFGASRSRAQDPIVRDPQKTFAAPVYSWKALREEGVVMQKHDYSCGAACLATVTRYFWGDATNEEQFIKATVKVLSPEQMKDRLQNGLTISDLRRAAVDQGYQASIGRIKFAELPDVKVPLIVRIKVNEFDHFVVFKGIVDDRVFLADPVRGNIRLSASKFSEQWPDRSLLVVVKPGVKDLPTDSILKDLPGSPVQHEYQAARGSLFQRP